MAPNLISKNLKMMAPNLILKQYDNEDTLSHFKNVEMMAPNRISRNLITIAPSLISKNGIMIPPNLIRKNTYDNDIIMKASNLKKKKDNESTECHFKKYRFYRYIYTPFSVKLDTSLRS